MTIYQEASTHKSLPHYWCGYAWPAGWCATHAVVDMTVSPMLCRWCARVTFANVCAHLPQYDRAKNKTKQANSHGWSIHHKTPDISISYLEKCQHITQQQQYCTILYWILTLVNWTRGDWHMIYLLWSLYAKCAFRNADTTRLSCCRGIFSWVVGGKQNPTYFGYFIFLYVRIKGPKKVCSCTPPERSIPNNHPR